MAQANVTCHNQLTVNGTNQQQMAQTNVKCNHQLMANDTN